jgi:catechol 2,3-dioxygenase-like lactoylglutathione lyase family enzyme
MAGSAASRASDFPNDHPAILIAVSSPGSPGDCRAAHEKALRAFSRTACVTTAAVRIPPLVNNHPRRKWFHATSTILRWRRDRDGIADARRLHWLHCNRPSAATTIMGETEMPTVIWDHVHLRSPDPEATAAWLEDILGGEIIRGPGRIDVKLGGANVFIAPVAAGDGVNTPPVTPYQGLDHFGLTVKDIDAVAAEIKAKGVEFTKEPTTIRPGVRICFIRGPQGISIELLERDKKYA